MDKRLQWALIGAAGLAGVAAAAWYLGKRVVPTLAAAGALPGDFENEPLLGDMDAMGEPFGSHRAGQAGAPF